MQRTLPTGFIAPCLPTKAERLPSGGEWLHEIKHDGFRVIARKHGQRVKLYSRPGNDLTYRFPLIVETLSCLRLRSCIIDGKAVACDDDLRPEGMTVHNIVEFKTADGEALAINVPVGETRVLKHFQKRMPYGLFVPDVDVA
jgi:bifunctional non-homologous end joining protein LigD